MKVMAIREHGTFQIHCENLEEIKECAGLRAGLSGHAPPSELLEFPVKREEID